MADESRVLISIAAYYENDKPGGIGFILPRKHFGEKLDMLATSIANAMLEYDRAAREQGESVMVAQLEGQLRDVANESSPDIGLAVVAMTNIHWLETRGLLQPDNFNGMLFQYAAF